MTRFWIPVALVALASCGRSGAPAAQPLQMAPLRFPERWVRGSVSYDPVAGRTPAKALPLTISLAVTSGSAAYEELGVGPFTATPCFQVRLLYRPAPSGPARVVVQSGSHLPGIWSEAPVFCVYVGTEWAWRLLLDPGTASSAPDVGGRLVVSVRGTRSQTEQFAVIITRRPRTDAERAQFDENFETFAVSRSEWFSLAGE